MSRYIRISWLLLVHPVAMAAQQAPGASLRADAAERFRNEVLTPSRLLGDVALADRALRALHPALFRYNTPDGWAARIDSMRIWASSPRTRGETFVEFSRLLASIRCSHTYLNYWNQPAAVQRWLLEGNDKLPFEYDLVAGDRWVVTRSATHLLGDSAAILPGDTIVAVNGTAVPQLVHELLPLIRADGDADGKRRALLDFRHRKEFEAIDVLLPLLHPAEREIYRITRRRAARDSVVSVASMSAARRRRDALPPEPEREPHAVSRDGDIAVLRVDRFDYGAGSASWPKFVREAFASFQRDSVRALILDLRQNEGGSDDGAQLLLSHLLHSPVVHPPLRRFVAYGTVPSALRPMLSTWDRSFYDRRGEVDAQPDGRFDLRNGSGWPSVISPAPDAFSGPVFVLTSYVNSSASHIMLRFLARQAGVTLVGEPTGGSLRAHTGGNLFFATLPGSGFEFDIPLIAYEWGAHHPAGGVMPDIAVRAKEALARALELARAIRR